MKELYSNEPNLLVHKIHVQGEPIRPEDGSISAELYVSNDKDFDGPAIPLTPMTVDRGKLEIVIQQQHLAKKRYAEVILRYTLADFGDFMIQLRYDITQRLITFEDLNDALGEGYEIDYATYSEAEAEAHLIIESYCNQKFESWEGERQVRGPEAHIYLPQHMEKLDNVVIHSSLIEFGFVTSVGGYTLQEQGMAVFNSDKIKTINMFRDTSAKNVNASITGEWGYSNVPAGIAMAAKEILKGFLCDDIEYRRRYIDNFRSGDMRIQINPAAYVDSTGNPIADQLLQPYRVFNVGVV